MVRQAHHESQGVKRHVLILSPSKDWAKKIGSSAVGWRHTDLAKAAMVFILSPDGRNDDPEGAFRRYEAYLQSAKADFPPSAFALATSGWYFGFGGHSPHDAVLEACETRRVPGG